MKRFTHDYEIDNEIAKALGWTDLKAHCPGSFCPLYHGVIPKQPEVVWTSTPQLVPRFSQDLNAMHKAEKVVEQIMHDRSDDYAYGDMLVQVTQDHRPISATARQRAEAFLRTLNLWPE